MLTRAVRRDNNGDLADGRPVNSVFKAESPELAEVDRLVGSVYHEHLFLHPHEIRRGLTAAITVFAVGAPGRCTALSGQRRPRREIDDQTGENNGREMSPRNLKAG